MAQTSAFLDPALAILDSIIDFNTVDLARSTKEALQIIMPWCDLKDTSKLVGAKEMYKQALAYARAIGFSVAAVHLKFAMAEDALALIEMIPNMSQEERREFLEGIRDTTAKGSLWAMEANKRFINVRTIVGSLLEKMRTEDYNANVEFTEVSNSFQNFNHQPFSEAQFKLSKGVHDLEEFSHILSQFTAWWNGIAIETNAQLSRGETVMKDLDSEQFGGIDRLRLPKIKNKWRNPRKQYAAYIYEIGNVLDCYPELFNAAELFEPPPRDSAVPINKNMNPQLEARGHDNLPDSDMYFEDFKEQGALSPDDIIIIVMGPAGSGKSNVIDQITGQIGKRAGPGMAAHTSDVSCVRIKNHKKYGSRIVLIDTPAFNPHIKILEFISAWLVQIHSIGASVHGIIYLHKITDIRMPGSHHLALEMLSQMCGEDAAKKVIFTTTMWDCEEERIGEEREECLKKTYWGPMIEAGALTARFDFEVGPSSAWEILEKVLARPVDAIPLQLQAELTDLGRPLHETSAAQVLLVPPGRTSLALQPESQEDDFFGNEMPKALSPSSSCPPEYTDRPIQARALGRSKVIISEELSKASYMSASLSNAQILEKNKCLLVLQLQFHTSSSHRRFTSLRIRWHFKPIRSNGGKERLPSLVDVAPMHNIGTKTERLQSHHLRGAQKLRAIVMQGFISGPNQDSAKWSVEENASAMSGIPPRISVAAVVDHEGPFMMELDIATKQQSGMGSWLSSRSHAKSEWFVVDAEKLQQEFPQYKPARGWQEWFPQISGWVF